MLFRKKGWLRKGFDEKLIHQLADLRQARANQKSLVEKSFEPSDEIICQVKLTEAMYFYLLKEAKYRKINFKNN